MRAGETLAEIAAHHRTSVAALVRANGITNPNRIRIGQRLTLPGPAWVCPVAGARFRDDYGFARSGGRFHEGNDLIAPSGTPVRAPVSGWLVHSLGPVGGLQFKLRGNDGATYFGTHMSRMGKGGPVAAGEVVGFVGATGNARGGRPHLHFEMHPGGKGPVNPYPRLVATCG